MWNIVALDLLLVSEKVKWKNKIRKNIERKTRILYSNFIKRREWMRAKDSVQQGGERDGTDQRLSKTGPWHYLWRGRKRKYCQCHKMCNEIETGIKGRAGTGKRESCSNGGSNYSCGKQRTVPGCNRDSCGRGIWCGGRRTASGYRESSGGAAETECHE